jgi:hypothetical protein
VEEQRICFVAWKTEGMSMSSICDPFVPRLLSNDQKEHSSVTCSEHKKPPSLLMMNIGFTDTILRPSINHLSGRRQIQRKVQNNVKSMLIYVSFHHRHHTQSSCLQIRRPGFDSRHYHEKKVVGLERGPLSLVSTTEELLDRKVAVPV